MQKKIIALAIAAAFSAPVVAMADVSLFGSFDAGYASTKDTAGISTTGMSTGTYATNNWGFKGSDDLGDGMKSTFQIESGFATNSGDGKTIGDRGIAVGLSAGWGAVVLGGNQYSTSFKVNKNFDPLGYKYIAVTGMGAVAAGANGRHDNDVAYTGQFGNVQVIADKTFNVSVDGNSVGNTTAVGAVYKSGAISAGASYSTTEKKVVQAGIVAANAPVFGENAAVTAAAAVTAMSVGAGFNFGDGSVSALYNSSKADGATDSTVTTVVGATYNVSNKIGVGAALYNQALGSVDAYKRTMLSATYALSKKTTAYAAYTSESVFSTTGYAVGLNAAF